MTEEVDLTDEEFTTLLEAMPAEDERALLQADSPLAKAFRKKYPAWFAKEVKQGLLREGICSQEEANRVYEIILMSDEEFEAFEAEKANTGRDVET